MLYVLQLSFSFRLSFFNLYFIIYIFQFCATRQTGNLIYVINEYHVSHLLHPIFDIGCRQRFRREAAGARRRKGADSRRGV